MSKWYFPFAPSPNWDTVSYMETTKQFFKQHDHATVLTLLIHFNFESHHTSHSYIYIATYNHYLISTLMFFLQYMMSILR